MTLTVIEKPGFVTIECDGKTVIVAGSVVWTTPASATGQSPPPTPPPILPPGPSVYLSVFATLPHAKRAGNRQDAFEQLIESDIFKDFTKDLDNNCVISIEPIAKHGPNPHPVQVETGKLNMMHHYLSSPKT